MNRLFLLYDKKWFRIFTYFFGLGILSMGQVFFVISNLGSGGYDAFCVGLAQKFGLTAGVWISLSSILMVLCSALLVKKKPNFLSLISSFVFGLFFDLWIYIFPILIGDVNLLYGILLFAVGIIFGPLGTAIYFISNFPKSTYDDFFVSLKTAFNLSMGAGKILCEVIFFAMATLVSGPIGWGTLLIAIMFGPVLQVFINILKIK